MDFLKNHYEKIVLSLVLIGLAAVGVWLTLQAVAFRGTIEQVEILKPNPSPPDPKAETNDFFEILTNSRTPRRVDFDGAHKIFNPEKILKNPVTRTRLPANELGPKAIQVVSIKPLLLRAKLEMKKIRDRVTINLHYLSEFESGRYAERWNRTSLKDGKTVRMSSPLARMRQMRMLVNSVNLTPETPDQMAAELELTIGSGLPRIIVLKGEQETALEMEYEADLHYPPDPTNVEFKNVRNDKPLVFGGDTNTVMQVSSNSVTLRALSNFKRTIRKLEEKKTVVPPADDTAKPSMTEGMAKPEISGDAGKNTLEKSPISGEPPRIDPNGTAVPADSAGKKAAPTP